MSGSASLDVSTTHRTLNRFVRIGVMISVGSVGLLGALGFGYAFVELDARSHRNAALSRLDLVYGFEAATPRSRSHRRVIETARATMPSDATYRVVVGPAWKPLWEVDWQGAVGRDVEVDFLRYFLLPRRESESGRWVFCLACERRLLGTSFRSLASTRDGFAFGRVTG
jgi:hypothetical protein